MQSTGLQREIWVVCRDNPLYGIASIE